MSSGFFLFWSGVPSNIRDQVKLYLACWFGSTNIWVNTKLKLVFLKNLIFIPYARRCSTGIFQSRIHDQLKMAKGLPFKM